jgi:hypothetical protein
MSMVIINPGAGPVDGATEENAINNIKHFVTDCDKLDLSWVRVPGLDYGEGRYAFLVWRGQRCHEIQMPGLPLERVRYTSDEQNIWDFPRLYVDGSSWVWKFAVLSDGEDWEEWKGGRE